MSSGLSIVLVGATGALGRELVDVLAVASIPVRELRLVATEESAGEDIEFRDDLITVQTELGSLRGVDVLLCCTPAVASLDLVRHALRAGVSCIDCSGALSARAEVPLLATGVTAPAQALGVPVIAAPGGPALAWAQVLRGLDEAASVERVVGTVLRSAASAGRQGIEALSHETIALLNQRPTEEADFFGRPAAFDCLPGPVEDSAADAVPLEAEGEAESDVPDSDASIAETGLKADERRLVAELKRLVSEECAVAVTTLQVPTFAGEGSALAVALRRPLSVAEALEAFSKTPSIRLWTDARDGPSMRDAIDHAGEILVGRVRRDASLENGLLLWLTADPLRLAATNVISLLETRLHLH